MFFTQHSAQRSTVFAERSLTLSEDLQAPARARAWFTTHTPDLPVPAVEEALLLVSELVTNAVRHGRPEIVLQIRRLPDRIRIEVRDEGDHLPEVPADRPSLDRPTGRGLLIVAATALDWGVERTPGLNGKTVWAEIDIAR